MDVLSVCAVIVTRGDQDIRPVLASIPLDWELVVWTNGHRVEVCPPGERVVRYSADVDDLGVYGRYAAIAHTDADLIYVQDDDCVVSDPQAIVDAWLAYRHEQYDFSHPDHKVPAEWADDHVVCNMPQEFRHSFYEEHALVGFGAAFHREAPTRAFGHIGPQMFALQGPEFFHRTCDIVFTALTPRVLVDVPRKDLPWSAVENRMWKQRTHQEERQRMLELVKKVRDQIPT